MPNRICLLALVLSLTMALGLGSNLYANNSNYSKDESQIRAVLDDQVQAWNDGDIEKFMAGYRKSDETTFVGADGVKRGWQAILDNYHQRYPDRTAMGKLNFSNLEVHLVDKRSAYALGKFKVERASGDASGYFSLFLRRLSHGWLIVSDHTTACSANKD